MRYEDWEDDLAAGIALVLLVLIFLIMGALFISTGALGQTPALPKTNVKCTLNNYPWEVLDAKTGEVSEKDDWRVKCTVKFGSDVIYQNKEDDRLDEIPGIVHPCEFRDAMALVDEFRTKRAPQLVKEWRKEHHK